MIEYEDMCVGCPPEIGCLGAACSNRNVPMYYCDECGKQDALYEYEGRQLCSECLIAAVPKVEWSY